MLCLALVDFCTFFLLFAKYVYTHMNYYFGWEQVLVSLVLTLFVPVAFDLISVDFKFQILL